MDRIKATKDDERELIFLTISNILKTGEYRLWKNKNFNNLTINDVTDCLYDQTPSQMVYYENTHPFDKFKLCCKEWDKNSRYEETQFYKLSTDFEQLWSVLNIGNELTWLITSV